MDKPLIDMVEKNGVFVPVGGITKQSTWVRNPVVTSGKTIKAQKAPASIESILTGMVTDFFKAMRREMFR